MLNRVPDRRVGVEEGTGNGEQGTEEREKRRGKDSASPLARLREMLAGASRGSVLLDSIVENLPLAARGHNSPMMTFVNYIINWRQWRKILVLSQVEGEYVRKTEINRTRGALASWQDQALSAAQKNCSVDRYDLHGRRFFQ